MPDPQGVLRDITGPSDIGPDVNRQISGGVEVAEYAVERARTGDLDVIHNMTAGLDHHGLRIVVAVLAEAFAGATQPAVTVWSALAVQARADSRRSA